MRWWKASPPRSAMFKGLKTSGSGRSPLKRRLLVARPLVGLVRSYRRFILKAQAGFKLTLGQNVVVGRGAEVYVPRKATIHGHVSIGSKFTSQVDFTIEDCVLISSQVSLIGNDHDLLSHDLAYYSGRNDPSSIIIERGAFVGFGATLLGNIKIGQSAIIGAKSFVNKSVPAGAVVVGCPARVIGYRKSGLKNLEEAD